MKSAFVIGATGYVGFNVATAFRRAGYRVWGLTRTEEKRRLLARNEILPIVGSMQDPASYRSVAESCEVFIQAAADYQNDQIALDKKTVEALIAIAEGSSGAKTVIYTSGVWVLGNTGGKAVTEATPLHPLKIVAWRPAHEQAVLQAGGIVLRPGCVYGKQGGLTAPWFDGATNKKDLTLVGDGKNRWAMVHADDLAEAYLLAAEKGKRGEVYNIADGSRATLRETVEAVARATGYSGKISFTPLAEAAKTMGDFAAALAIDQQVDASKAARELGWHPRRSGFIQDVEAYLASWRAAQR